MRPHDERGSEHGRDAGAGPRVTSETPNAEAEAPAAGSRKVAPRVLYGLAAVVLGAALPLGCGLVSHALGKAVAAAPRPPTQPGPGEHPPSVSKPAVPVPPPAGAPGVPPVSPPPAATPAVDPRIARALDTRVFLQAEKVSLWTEVRRLGVRLAWPQGGEPQWTLDEREFSRSLRRLARRVERLPHGARLLHTAQGFHTLPASPGRALDRAAAKRQLMTALVAPAFRHSLDADPLEKPAPIKLSIPLRPLLPTVTAAHLGAINTLLASYSTGLGSSSRNRRHNIRVACAAIDGTVLMPGDVFSYNQTVGPRTERAGFRTAPVIIHGELVPGTGGGICQVSTTLYNVALLGDLKIVRRSHHQFPVHYVPPGRDATVAYGSLDLRFANSLPGPVALDVKTVGSRVVIHLYGTAACKRDVQLVSSRVIRTRPRAAAGGGPPRPGKRVTVMRVVRLEDGTVRRELISHDNYAPPPLSSHGAPVSRTRARHRRSTGGRPKEAPPEHPSAVKPLASARQSTEGR